MDWKDSSKDGLVLRRIGRIGYSKGLVGVLIGLDCCAFEYKDVKSISRDIIRSTSLFNYSVIRPYWRFF
jgi:hypothetical protein